MSGARGAQAASGAGRPAANAWAVRASTGAPWWGLAAASVLADFATKHLVRERMVEGASLPLAPFFNLVSARNSGAAFSFLADAGGWQRWFFVALALVVSAVLAWMLSAKRPGLEALAYAMILGGAIGNAIDRFVFGRVTDFLDFHWAGWHWPAFNVADIAIFTGAACLVLASLKTTRPSA